VEFFIKKISILQSSSYSHNNIPSSTQQQQSGLTNKAALEKQKAENLHKPIIMKLQSQVKQEYEDNFANKLMTQSVYSQIEEIKSLSNDYLPKRVNKALRMPVAKSTPEYDKVKAEIISNIEDGICELDYFNIDYAKEHVECALYYLRNIIQKN